MKDVMMNQLVVVAVVTYKCKTDNATRDYLADVVGSAIRKSAPGNPTPHIIVKVMELEYEARTA